MYPDVPRDCDEIIVALPDEVLGLSANSPKSPFKGITKEELLNSPLVKDLAAHEFKEAKRANAQAAQEAQKANAQETHETKRANANRAPKAKKVNAQKSPKAHKEKTQKAQGNKPLVANDETSQADEPNSLPPRILGRAVAPLKKYKKKNKDRS